MSTLSLRKIKHDSSSVDNITLNSDGTTTMNRSLVIDTATNGVPSISLKHSNTDADNFIIQAGTAGVTNGGLTIRDIDAAANRLIIDSAGRVTMPSQPMALVAMNTTQSINHDATVKVQFNTIVNQSGSNFNTSTNRFTAPVSGWYIVMCHLYIYSVAQAEVYIYKNGSGVSYMRSASAYLGTNRNPHGSQVNHVLYLNASDYIEIYAYQYSEGASSGSIYYPASALNIGLLY